MQMLAHSQLWEDGLSEEYPPFHSGKFGKGIIQLEDDSYPKKEARSPQTVCTPIQIPDTGDSSTPFTPGASICNYVIMADLSTVKISDAGFVDDKVVGEDDFSDEYALAIEVKPEKQEYDKEPLYQDLYRIYRECSESDWDNYGANPINEQTFSEAMMLLDKLPSELPLPEVMPEPTGNIAFEWYKGKKYVYVISVGGKSTIEYAGLFGRHSKTYGAEYFSGELPELIVSNISRLFS